MANTELLKALLGASYKDGMTPDEIVNALDDLEEDPIKKAQEEAKNLKTRLSEANSEAANFKKQLRAKLTEEEAKKAEQEEALATMKNQLEELKKEKELAGLTAKFASAGFEDAGKVASAFMENDIDSFVTAINAKSEKDKDKYKAELMKGTKRPFIGDPEGKKITKEELYKMPLVDRVKFIQEHRDEYDQLMKED